MASQMTSLTIVYSTVYSGADQKTSKLRVTDLCAWNSAAGNSPVTAQMTSNAEIVSMQRVQSVQWFRRNNVRTCGIQRKIMMTSSNGNIFHVTGPLCGEFTGPGEFPTQRPVTRSFDVFFDLRLNKRLSKQPWGWWLEAPSWSLWRQCNGYIKIQVIDFCKCKRSSTIPMVNRIG